MCQSSNSILSLIILLQKLSNIFHLTIKQTKIDSKINKWKWDNCKSRLPWWLNCKELACQWRSHRIILGLDSSVGNPPDKKMETHSNILAWEVQCTEESSGLQCMGSQKSWHTLATEQYTVAKLLKDGILTDFRCIYTHYILFKYILYISWRDKAFLSDQCKDRGRL